MNKENGKRVAQPRYVTRLREVLDHAGVSAASVASHFGVTPRAMQYYVRGTLRMRDYLRPKDVCVIATPHAVKFVDIPLLEQLTGHPVRSEYKRPEDPDILPRADAFVVLPATFNTLNKLAQGITDTLAVGLLCEYLCLGAPIVAVPNFHEWDMGRHPAIQKSIATLRECGMNVLYEPEKYPPSNNIPWDRVLEELHKLVDRTGRRSHEPSI